MASVEHVLSSLSGPPPPAGMLYYPRGYMLQGMGKWQKRSLVAAALPWLCCAESVLLHVFTESACSCTTTCGVNVRGSVVEDFGLCGWKATVLGLLYFLPGWFLGAATAGWASDRWGRRPALVVFMLLSVVSTFLVASSNCFALYAVARSAMGFSYGGACIVSYVLGCEIVPTAWLSLVGVGFFNLWFVLGAIALPAFASLVSGWATLYVLVGAQAVVATIVVYALVPESPKWLVLRGRCVEAHESLCAAARMEKSAAGSEAVRSMLVQIDEGGGEEAPREADESMTMFGMFRRPRMAFITLVAFFAWLAVGAVYYGLSFIAGDLPGDLYVNALLSGLVELPGSVLGNILVEMPCLGRRGSTTACFAIAAGACAIAAFSAGAARTVVAFVGKAHITAVFCVLYVYGAELLPTPVRNTGMGMSSQIARVGSGAATGLVTAVPIKVAMIIFTILAALAALATRWVLPETFGFPLPHTIDDVTTGRGRQGDIKLSSAASDDFQSVIDPLHPYDPHEPPEANTKI